MPHPCPTAFELYMEIARLTRCNPAEVESRSLHLVEGYARVSLGAVDRFFLQARYALDPLDRSRVTGRLPAKKHHRAAEYTWDVYHPYNPVMVQRLLNYLRLDYNWCKPGRDHQTPAMRLGLVEEPLSLVDLLEVGGDDMHLVREAEALLQRQVHSRAPQPAPAPTPEPAPEPSFV